MHELSVAENILDVIEGVLGGRRPLGSATLTVGPLSGVSADALRFCFSQLAKARGFGDPDLVISETEASVRCRRCANEYETDALFCACPSCGELDKEILGGRELRIDSVELLGESGRAG
jgi:hydrogenase nickel incorporation protein HypA/HybF